MHNFKGTTILKQAGHDIPLNYLEKVLEVNPKFLGVCIAKDGALIHDVLDDGLPIDAIQELMEGAKDNPMMLFFGHYPDNTLADNLQPFILFSQNDQPMVAACITGPFTKHIEQEGKHSPHFLYVNNYLIGRLQEIYELSEGDLTKFVTHLRKDSVAKDVMGHSEEPFTITLLTAKGDHLAWNNSTEMYVGPATNQWGWGSNHHGMNDVPAKPASKVSVLLTKLQLPNHKVEDTPTGVQPEKHDQPTATAQFKPPQKNGLVSLRPPPEVRSSGRQSIKNWYIKYNSARNKHGQGLKPSNWPDCPAVDVKVEVALAAQFIDQTGNLLYGTLGSKLKSIASTTPIKVEEEEKEEEEAEAEEEAEVVEDAASKIFVPLLNKEELENVKALEPKVLDINSTEIIHPNKMQGQEKPLPMFSMAIGRPFSTTILWSPETLLELGQYDVKSLVMWAMEARAEYAKLLVKQANQVSETKAAVPTVAAGQTKLKKPSRV